MQDSITRSFEIYSDVNKNTPLEKSRIVNEDSIKNSIRNILNVKDKEELFNFSNQKIPSFIFKTYTAANAFALRNHIIDVLSKETRISISVKETTVVADVTDKTYSITIKYTIKGTTKELETRFKI